MSVLVSVQPHCMDRMSEASFIASGNKAPEPTGWRRVSYKHASMVQLHAGLPWRIRLLVRTEDFQSSKRGSIPLCATKPSKCQAIPSGIPRSTCKSGQWAQAFLVQRWNVWLTSRRTGVRFPQGAPLPNSIMEVRQTLNLCRQSSNLCWAAKPTW